MTIVQFPKERQGGKRATDGSGVDNGGGPPHDGGMEARVTKLETDLTAIKIDLAVIKANGAVRSDVVEVRELLKSSVTEFKAEVDKSASKMGKDLADSQTKIILWIVATVFVAQLLPMIKDLVRPAATPASSAASTAAPASSAASTAAPARVLQAK